MPFRRTALSGDHPSHDEAPEAPPATELALTLAEAEAAEAEAVAAAATARARVARLRRASEHSRRSIDTTDRTIPESQNGASPSSSEAGEPADDSVAPLVAEPAPSRGGRRMLRTVAAALVVVVTTALLTLSGYFMFHHRQAEKARQQAAEYSAAGRQSVVTLMSLDFSKAQEDAQRIIDNSTGSFKDDFEAQTKDFVKVAQDSKVVTEVTVSSSAVQQMDDDSAVVLVAASSRVTNAAGAKQEPRNWRLSVDLKREGDQIKMSKVEFVP